MPDSISSKIISSSADRIENLSNDIVSNANDIHAIVHPTGNTSGWDSVCMWFQNYSLKNNVQDFFQMDGWNLFITIFINVLSLYVIFRGFFIIRSYKKEKIASNNIKKKEGNEEKTNNKKSVLQVIMWCFANALYTLINLPSIIFDFYLTLVDYWNNEIKFDRDILSTNGYPLLKLSLKLAILLPLTITFIIAPFGIISQLINGGSYTSALGIYDTKSAEYTNVLWATISQYMDPGNLSNSDSIGSVIAIIMAASGIVCLSGLMVSSLVNWISQRRDRWQKGLIVYKDVKSFTDYVVIIGINEQAASIVRQSLKRDGVKYVLIQTRQDVEKTRLELELKMDDDLEDKIVFYAGERTSAEDLGKLHLEKAIEVYILGENINYENEKDHDAFNANCLDHISNYIKEYKLSHKDWNKRLRVHVDFEYQSTFTAFKATHLYQKLDRDIEFVPFNVHEIWAKKVLVDNFAVINSGKSGEFKVQRYNPIDTYIDEESNKRNGITDSCGKRVHLVVLGMNQMGTALATQAALLCHFPNFKLDKSRRTTITFIDDHAKEEGDYFMGRFSTLFELSRHRTVICNKNNLHYYGDDEIELQNQDENYVPFTDNMNGEEYLHLITKDEKHESFLDIEWEFIQGNIASEEVKDYIEGIATDPRKITTIAICFNHSQQSIASAMYLPANVYNYANQVLVYQQNCFDLVNDVANGDVEWKRYPNLFPFGMIESSYTENQFDNHLAKLLHCQYQGKVKKDEHLLKTIDAIWDQLGIVQKLANIDLVDSIPMKYRSMGIDNPHNYDSLPQTVNVSNMAYSEHLRWTVERLMMGYRCLTETEQKPFVNQKEENYGKQNQSKRRYMGKERAHLDICSGLRLKEIDPIVVKKDNDRELISSLPELLKLAEWVSVLRLSDKRYEKSQHVKFLRDILTNYTSDTLHFKFIEGLGKDKKYPDKTNHSFWMAVTPVTQSQWEKVIGVKKTVDSEKSETFMQDNMPVVNVSKQDVDDFLDILRKRTGLYFTLPSKKEWRYAAQKAINEDRDNGISPNYWVNSEGEQIDIPTKITKIRFRKSSTPIIQHILGNVWEWTREEDKNHRFEFCGGSWRFTNLETNLEEDYWHNAWEKEMKSDDLGFRLIWKFDVKAFGNSDLYQMMLPQDDKTYESQNDTLISDWFKYDRKDDKEGIRQSKMVLVKAGKFVMGANENIDHSADKNELPRHIVHISNDYFICEIPVTQYLWNLVIGKKNPTQNRLGDNLPQTDVSWDDVQRFINILNEMKKNGKLKLEELANTDNLVFRLPTEAEWEYASKEGHLSTVMFENAGKCTPFKIDKNDKKNKCDYIVNDVKYPKYSGSNDANEVAWYGDSVIREVALKKPNALGLFDMSGNIWEWCHDFYVWDMYDKGNVIDPLAPSKGYAAHVFRGGSWRSTEWDCRCTRANFWIATHKSNDLGFRLVLGKPIDSIEHNKPLNL